MAKNPSITTDYAPSKSKGLRSHKKPAQHRSTMWVVQYHNGSYKLLRVLKEGFEVQPAHNVQYCPVKRRAVKDLRKAFVEKGMSRKDVKSIAFFTFLNVDCTSAISDLVK